MNDVIADARSAERGTVEVVATTPANVATPTPVAPVIEEVAVPAEPVVEVAEVAEAPEATDNPFIESATTVESKPATTVAKAAANEFFEEVEERDTDDKAFEDATVAMANPAITSTAGTQSGGIQTVDYVALCPKAGDQVKSLLSTMNSNDVSQIKPALHKLGELAEEGTASEPAIRVALTHADSYVRIHAALALWRVQQNTDDTLPVFLEGLQSSDAGVRSFAATAMAMGPQVDAAISPLTSALKDSNAFVRLHAAETLYQYPGQEAGATQAIVAHLNDKEANVRWLATFILGEIHPESDVAVTALIQALKDGDKRIRAGAAFALGGFGKQASTALPELKKLTADAQPDVRKAAEEAVRDIEYSTAHASN